MDIEIVSVNISKEKGTSKYPVDIIELTNEGITGDAHSGKWHRQISLLGVESINSFSLTSGRNFNYGDFAENITTKGIKLNNAKPGDTLVGSEIVLQITQIGKKCHGSGCAIFNEVGSCIMPNEGIFAKVKRPGKLKAGDILEYRPKIYRIGVITLSNRASMEVYPDLSGPQIISDMERFATSIGWTVQFDYHLIPDNKEMLSLILAEMTKTPDLSGDLPKTNSLSENQVLSESHMDIVFTTGGTGIGPDDFTPEVVKTFFDKEIPGIMDYIRLKYGAIKPNALLSRSIAGLANESLIFTLPGSKKAVTEYMSEITPMLEHLIHMKMGLDNHH